MTVGRLTPGLVSLALIGAAANLYARSPPTCSVPVAHANREDPLAATMVVLGDGKVAHGKVADGKVVDGKAMFEHECVKCHGTHGRGDGPKANELKRKPADLTSADAQGQSDGGLFWKITMGKKPMPIFGSELTEEQRWKLVVYVRSLAAK